MTLTILLLRLIFCGLALFLLLHTVLGLPQVAHFVGMGLVWLVMLIFPVVLFAELVLMSMGVKAKPPG